MYSQENQGNVEQLDKDQARQKNVLDLGPKCLLMLSADNSSSLENQFLVFLRMAVLHRFYCIGCEMEKHVSIFVVCCG